MLLDSNLPTTPLSRKRVAPRDSSAVEARVPSLPELRRICAFLAVAEELHYGRAANRLAMQQSPLSRLIMGLERDLGVKLFTRNRRTVRLTIAGSTFLENVPAVVAAIDAATHKARSAALG